MNKIILISLLIACFSIFSTGEAVAAGVVGTPHDATSVPALSETGTCSVCHVPHKSMIDALWTPYQAGDSLGKASGEVASLCSACHTSYGGYANIFTQASFSENFVFSDLSHGMKVNQTVMTDTQDDIYKSGLPYTGADDYAEGGAVGLANTIQCTTCHNVHDNETNRPFLRVNIRDLCVLCHLGRAHSGGEWIEATYIGYKDSKWVSKSSKNIDRWSGGFGLNNLGSHPVGVDITADRGGASPIIDFPTTWMQLFESSNGALDATYADGGGRWNLGRHTATGAGFVPGSGIDGGVTCVSCHAVHGVQDDSDPSLDLLPNDGTPFSHNPNVNLLAYPQSVTTLAGMKIANGMYSGDRVTDGRSGLCEQCHIGGTTGAETFRLVQGNGELYGGKYRPNPGATDYSHPIDDAVALTDPVSAFPAGWPRGDDGKKAGAGYPRPICESCHVPHAARAAVVVDGGRKDLELPVNTRDRAGSGQFLLRAKAADICGKCHRETKELGAGKAHNIDK